jgi:hypothetical protein
VAFVKPLFEAKRWQAFPQTTFAKPWVFFSCVFSVAEALSSAAEFLDQHSGR